jgi:hypothetical protein
MLVFMSNGLSNCREQATVFVRYVLISLFYHLSIQQLPIEDRTTKAMQPL